MQEDGVVIPDRHAEIRRQEFAALDQALREGNALHGFLSPERLRVMRLQQDDKITGFAARHTVDRALSYVIHDYKGEKAAFQPVSGNLHVVSLLDAWVLLGNTFDAFATPDGQIVCDLKSLKEVEVPAAARKQARKGLPTRWRSRGFTFETSLESADGKEGYSTKVVEAVGQKSQADAFMYPIRKTGRGRSFEEALANAFEAYEVSVSPS